MIPISGFNQKRLTLELMSNVTVSQLESFNMLLAWWLAKFVAKEAVADSEQNQIFFICVALTVHYWVKTDALQSTSDDLNHLTLNGWIHPRPETFAPELTLTVHTVTLQMSPAAPFIYNCIYY